VATHVPVIPWKSVDNVIEDAEAGPHRHSTDWVFTTKPVGAGVFALRIQGEPMEPAETGEMAIVVDPHGLLHPGSLVVARCGPNEAIGVKRLVDRAGRQYLEPLDHRFPHIKVTSLTKIYGVVRQKVVDCDQ
jgi:SOS-response transcriptional repressor LexA